MGKARARILYLVPEWQALTSGVLHAQVFSPAKFLSRHGYQCLFVGSESTDDKAKEANYRIENSYNIEASVVGVYSDKYGWLSLDRTCRQVMRRTRDRIDSFRPTHVYTRSILPASVARAFCRRRQSLWVHDVRGTLAEERALRIGQRDLKYKLALRKEVWSLREANRVSCVSSNLRKWITQQTGRTDVAVIPSCVDREEWKFDSVARARIRRELGIGESEVVICYSGGLSKWQRVDDIIEVLGGVADRDDSVRLLFLTKNAPRMEAMVAARRIDAKRYDICSCAHGEVAQYLSAADAGIIMRDDVIVNNVASPIKIGEYLACGLSVLLTKGIGDFGQAIADRGAGVLLDEGGDMAGQILDHVKGESTATRRRHAEEFCEEFFSFSAYYDRYNELYSI